jgi:ribosome biogenesis GTPase A
MQKLRESGIDILGKYYHRNLKSRYQMLISNAGKSSYINSFVGSKTSLKSFAILHASFIVLQS